MKVVSSKQISIANQQFALEIVEVTGTAGGREFGIFKLYRGILRAAGVQYKSSRTKGVVALCHHEFDARNKNSTKRALDYVQKNLQSSLEAYFEEVAA